MLDNVDWDVKVHDMRSDKQNRSVHAVATSLVFDRVSSSHLPDTGPKKNLANCNLKDTLSLTDEENQCTRERYKVLIGRILVEFLPAFDFLKDVVPDHTPCEYHEEMNTKSVVVPVPVLLKDEKNYAEVVDVLDDSLSSGHMKSTVRLACVFQQTQTMFHLLQLLDLLLERINQLHTYRLFPRLNILWRMLKYLVMVIN